MKRILLFLVIIVLSTSVYADKKTPTEKAQSKTEEMQKDLQLTADQVKKIYDINLRAYTAIADYETKNKDKKLRKKQKNIVQDLRDDQYKKILTSAQYKKYKDLKKKEKEEEKKLEQLKEASKKKDTK